MALIDCPECGNQISEGTYQYKVKVAFRGSGRHGFTIRLLPNYKLLLNPYELGLICWADESL